MNSPLHYQSNQSPVIFSFGQQDNSNTSSASNHHLGDFTSRNKLSFVKKLIEKYEVKPCQIQTKPKPVVPQVNQELFLPFLAKSQKQPLSTSRNHPTDENPSEQGSTKDQILVESETKLQLEESHQSLLCKYATPVREFYQDSADQNQNQNSSKIHYEKTIFEFLNSSKDETVNDDEVKTSSYNEAGSIPLIESTLVFQERSKSSEKQESMAKQPILQELSEFQDDHEKGKNDEMIQPFNRESLDEDELKLSQLLTFCILVLFLLFLAI